MSWKCYGFQQKHSMSHHASCKDLNFENLVFLEFSFFFLRIFAWIYFHQASIIIDDSFFTKRTSSHSNVESQSSTKSVRAGRRWDCFKIFFLLFLLKKNKNTVPLKALQDWKDRSDVTMRALSLLNSFVPTEIHKACLGKFLV